MNFFQEFKEVNGPILFTPNLTELSILNTKWDPSMIRMENIRRITLDGARTCAPQNFDFKNKLQYSSKLSDLEIVYTIGDALRCIDIPEKLYLNRIKDDICFDMPYLRELVISECKSIESIKNVEFPNLDNLEIYESEIKELVNFKAPLLRTLLWSSDHISSTWTNVELPSLIDVNLELHSLLAFDVECPNLFSAYIKCYEQPLLDLNSQENYDNHFKGLEEVKGMDILGVGLQVIEGLNMKDLEMLTITDEYTHQLSQRTLFPKLHRLEFCNNDIMQQIPKINSPNLKTIELVELFGLKSLDNLPKDYPFLKELKIDNTSLITIKNLHLTKLKVLEIHTNSPDFTLDNCSFDELEILKISTNGGSNYEGRTSGGFRISAPELQKLSLSGLCIGGLISTSPFPNLEELYLNCTVRELHIADSEDLVRVFAPCGLQSLKVGNLRHLKGHDPPRRVHPLYKISKDLAEQETK